MMTNSMLIVVVLDATTQEKKSQDDECSTCTKKNQEVLVLKVFALNNQDDELQLVVLVEKLTQCNKNHDDEL